MKPIDQQQFAYKPLEIQKGIYISSPIIDYDSKETFAKKYSADGQLTSELKMGILIRYVYDKGVLRTTIETNSTGDLVKKTTFEYDANNYLKRVTFIHALDDFKMEHVGQEFYYNDEKDQVCLHFTCDKHSYWQKTKYGENLKIVEYLKVDKTPYQKIEYYYEKELLIKQIQINLPSSLVEQSWKYVYNRKGNCIAMQRSGSKNEPQLLRVYEYDFFQNCTKEQLIYSPTNKVIEEFKTIYEYNDNGIWLRKTIFKNEHILRFVYNKADINP